MVVDGYRHACGSDTDATPIPADPQTAKPEKVGNAKGTHPLARCCTPSRRSRMSPSNRNAKPLRNAESRESKVAASPVFFFAALLHQLLHMGFGRSIPASFHCNSCRLSFTLNCWSRDLSGGR